MRSGKLTLVESGPAYYVVFVSDQEERKSDPYNFSDARQLLKAILKPDDFDDIIRKLVAIEPAQMRISELHNVCLDDNALASIQQK